MRTTGTAARARRARTNQPKLEVVVGFDSEWVDASHEDDGIPPNASNRILSWQFYLLSSSGAMRPACRGEGRREVEPTASRHVARNGCTESNLGRYHSKPTRRHSSRRTFFTGRSFHPARLRKAQAQVFGGSPHLRYDNETASAPHSHQSGPSPRFGATRGHHVDSTCRCVTRIARCNAGCAKG